MLGASFNANHVISLIWLEMKETSDQIKAGSDGSF